MNTAPFSIRTALMLSFLLLMVFPMIVITYVTYSNENHLYKDQVSQYLLQTVQQAHRSLDANLREIDRLTWSILYQDTLDFLYKPQQNVYDTVQSTEAFRKYVYSELFRGDMNQVRSVSFITPDHVVLSTENFLQSYSQINQQRFEEIVRAVNEEPLRIHWFSDEYKLTDTQSGFDSSIRDSVTAVRRVLDSRDIQLKGYLVIQFNDRFIRDVLQDVKIGQTGSLLVMDATGQVVYRQDAELLNKPEVLEALKSKGNAGTGIATVKGQWLVASETSAVSGWRMIAVVPLSELIAANQNLLSTLILLAAGGVVVSVIVSVSLANAISRPIIRLARLMSRASQGNMGVREHAGSYQEISILQRNFNHLLERIKLLLEEKEQEQKEKREVMLRALQTQIHPHFLYNTLDTIYWMSKKFKDDSISQLAAALGTFFRLSLIGSMDATTLEKEFDHVSAYLQVQSVRYRNKVLYELVLDDRISQERIIPLILQPIVENALEHGIGPKSSKGSIRIEGTEQEGIIVLRIADDGVGMDERKLAEVNEALLHTGNVEHLGLRNVQQRIQMQYGNRYGLSIFSEPNAGTEVVVSLPLFDSTGDIEEEAVV